MDPDAYLNERNRGDGSLFRVFRQSFRSSFVVVLASTALFWANCSGSPHSRQSYLQQNASLGIDGFEQASYQTQSGSGSAQPSHAQVELQESGESLFAISVRPLRSPWTARKEIGDRLKVLTMNNFDWEYIQGGIIPKEGAEITVSADSSKKDLAAVDAVIKSFQSGDTNVRSTGIRVANCSAKQIESQTEFAPSLTYKRVALFLPVRHKDSVLLYKFILMYNADDDPAQGKSFRSAFDQVVKSAVLTTPDAGCMYAGT